MKNQTTDPYPEPIRKERPAGKNSRRERPSEKHNELMAEGRNAVLEALKTNENADKLYVQEGLGEGPVSQIVAEARSRNVLTVYVPKEKLDQMSETGRHQGVILNLSAISYADVDDILRKASEKGEKPFLFVLDGIEDPHNLGAIIRSANLAGAHGVIIPRHRAASVNATVAKASAGAVYHTLIAKVTNLAQTIEELKEKGIWFVCADMDGEVMYQLDLRGAIGLVIGNEGTGVSRLVREKCDFAASIPMKGDIDSLNASVAAGILAWEIVRQNSMKP
ncbi:MAG: 23S rRNA (guanosine(2251)-2'-O)-methyltransferase RlmB [Parasporobacterium sp.]|nr:23S rRNA (guanosine(2251)-2'-O)-methyltransferase RlmB [Parasporobacterium sp.]